MSLTGQQVYEFQQALLDAYRTQGELRQMVRVHLDENLDAVAGGANLAEVTFNLIAFAESRGRTDELLSAALAERAQNSMLSAFAEKLQGEPIDLSAAVTIHDQKDETSAAMAVVTALETSFALQGKQVDLSVRYLYEKSRLYDGLPDNVMGTYLDRAIACAQLFGVPPESEWPYAPSVHDLPQGRSWSDLDQAAVSIAETYRLADYGQLHGYLMKRMPVVTGIVVTEDWYDAPSGYIEASTKPMRGMHGVVIVAYNPRTDLVRFANSWGVNWGDQGFGSMKLETLRQWGVIDQAWAVEAKPQRYLGG